MHGKIFKTANDFVVEKFDSDTWDRILQQADTDSSMFLPIKSYPAEDLLAIVSVAVDSTDFTKTELLYDFGVFAAPRLAETFEMYIEDEWDAFDLLEYTESVIHDSIRDEDYSPPELSVSRPSEDEVRIQYGSNLQLCAFAEGVINGILGIYDADAGVTHEQCMHDGADECEFIVTR